MLSPQEGIMRSMKSTLVILTVSFTLFLLAACEPAAVPQAAATPESVLLTPYVTLTPTLTPSPVPTLVPTATLVPTITLTPQIYVVSTNDTLFTIAARSGLTVAELTAANPGVSAYSLYVGTKLIIPPMGSGGTQAAPTATPAPHKAGEARCYPSLTGGAFCFALVENESDNDLENLTAEFTLTDPNNGEVLTQDTYLPLARLPQGGALPFYVYFAPPVFARPEVSFRVLSALPVTEEKASIYMMKVRETVVEMAADNLSAEISGLANFDGNDEQARFIRVLAVVYDAGGNVVGMRRYEEEAGLKAGEDFEFKLLVESVGGVIAQVDVFAEAQP